MLPGKQNLRQIFHTGALRRGGCNPRAARPRGKGSENAGKQIHTRGVLPSSQGLERKHSWWCSRVGHSGEGHMASLPRRAHGRGSREVGRGGRGIYVPAASCLPSQWSELITRALSSPLPIPHPQGCPHALVCELPAESSWLAPGNPHATVQPLVWVWM